MIFPYIHDDKEIAINAGVISDVDVIPSLIFGREILDKGIKWNNISADTVTFATSEPGIFTGGDVVYRSADSC